MRNFLTAYGLFGMQRFIRFIRKYQAILGSSYEGDPPPPPSPLFAPSPTFLLHSLCFFHTFLVPFTKTAHCSLCKSACSHLIQIFQFFLFLLLLLTIHVISNLSERQMYFLLLLSSHDSLSLTISLSIFLAYFLLTQAYKSKRTHTHTYIHTNTYTHAHSRAPKYIRAHTHA